MTARRATCKADGCTEKVRRVRIRDKKSGESAAIDDEYCADHRFQLDHEIVRNAASRLERPR